MLMRGKETLTPIGEIESEAEKLLEKARIRAGQILLDAEKRVEEIMASEFSVDEIKTKRDKIISTAEEEAGIRIEASKKEGSKLKVKAMAKAGEAVELILNHIRGIYYNSSDR